MLDERWASRRSRKLTPCNAVIDVRRPGIAGPARALPSRGPAIAGFPGWFVRVTWRRYRHRRLVRRAASTPTAPQARSATTTNPRVRPDLRSCPAHPAGGTPSRRWSSRPAAVRDTRGVRGTPPLPSRVGRCAAHRAWAAQGRAAACRSGPAPDNTPAPPRHAGEDSARGAPPGRLPGARRTARPARRGARPPRCRAAHRPQGQRRRLKRYLRAPREVYERSTGYRCSSIDLLSPGITRDRCAAHRPYRPRPYN